MTTAAVTTTGTPTTRAGTREWVGLGVLALACPLYVMDLTVLHLSAAIAAGLAVVVAVVALLGLRDRGSGSDHGRGAAAADGPDLLEPEPACC